MQYHGGDIYRNQIRLDFSVNTNPLGMPDSVREALHQAVEEAEHYPDIHAQELANAVAEQLRISEKKLVFGRCVRIVPCRFYTQKTIENTDPGAVLFRI